MTMCMIKKYCPLLISIMFFGVNNLACVKQKAARLADFKLCGILDNGHRYRGVIQVCNERLGQTYICKNDEDWRFCRYAYDSLAAQINNICQRDTAIYCDIIFDAKKTNCINEHLRKSGNMEALNYILRQSHQVRFIDFQADSLQPVIQLLRTSEALNKAPYPHIVFSCDSFRWQQTIHDITHTLEKNQKKSDYCENNKQDTRRVISQITQQQATNTLFYCLYEAHTANSFACSQVFFEITQSKNTQGVVELHKKLLNPKSLFFGYLELE